MLEVDEVHGGGGEDETAQEPLLHASVYEELRRRLTTGNIVPGVSLSTRRLAAEMGVSQMPVREALGRLSAEGAVLIRSKRKIETPPMTRERFTDLLACRLLLEPEAAVQALPYLDAQIIAGLRALDGQLDAAIATGDVMSYMRCNAAFHFGLYRMNGRPTLNRLIESLWLQFGPFMRTVHDCYGAANLVDQHKIALGAAEAGDADALRAAIAADIADGMGLVGQAWLRSQAES
jgi:DNA-binding GntR family transcriptional regulator